MQLLFAHINNFKEINLNILSKINIYIFIYIYIYPFICITFRLNIKYKMLNIKCTVHKLL